MLVKKIDASRFRKKQGVLLLFIGVCVSCLVGCQEKSLLLRQPSKTYTLVLTDTSHHTSDWLAQRRSWNLSHQTIAVSGYAAETDTSLLQRLPWLLQPGVDTLAYDPDLAGQSAVKLLENYLQENSPTTVFLEIE